MNHELSKALQEIINSMLAGKPTYLCSLPGLTSAAYHVCKRRDGVLITGELTTLAIQSSDFSLVSKVIKEAHDLYVHRMSLDKRTAELISTVTKTSEITVRVTGIQDDIHLNLISGDIEYLVGTKCKITLVKDKLTYSQGIGVLEAGTRMGEYVLCGLSIKESAMNMPLTMLVSPHIE